MTTKCEHHCSRGIAHAEAAMGRTVLGNSDCQCCCAAQRPPELVYAYRDAITPHPTVALVSPVNRDYSKIAYSIDTCGYIEKYPILVVPEGRNFLCIDGLARLRAASEKGIMFLPALVMDGLHESSIITELQRRHPQRRFKTGRLATRAVAEQSDVPCITIESLKARLEDAMARPVKAPRK